MTDSGITIIDTGVGNETIYMRGGEWFFLDEIWEAHGPYETRDEASEEMAYYIEHVLG